MFSTVAALHDGKCVNSLAHVSQQSVIPTKLQTVKHWAAIYIYMYYHYSYGYRNS